MAATPFRDTPTCSVVICTRKRSVQLAECLEAVSCLKFPEFEIVVVDSAPVNDDARHIAARWGARYIIEPHIGVSRARNRGARACATEIVAFLDDDALPEQNWLSALAREFHDPVVMAVGGRVVGLGSKTAAERILYEKGGFDHGQERREVDSNTPSWFEISNFGGLGEGGNMAFRREAFNVWHGFNEALGKGTPLIGGEEHHAFFSLIALGYRVVYTPDSVVRHPSARTPEQLCTQRSLQLAGAVGYLTMMIVEQGGYRWAALKYAFEGIRRRPRKWRAGTAVSSFRILPISRTAIACLKGPLLYGLSRLVQTAEALRQILQADAPGVPERKSFQPLGTATPSNASRSRLHDPL